MMGLLLAGVAIFNIAGASLSAKKNSHPFLMEQVVLNDSDVSDTKAIDIPLEGDRIGTLTIPVLNKELAVFQGTSVKTLNKGVGHYTNSVMPGEKDNTVLSGHRDTVFTKLGDLSVGDQLIVETKDGKFTYVINGTRIVDKDDKTVIVPMDRAVLTLTTCYPFHFIGKAPDRYIITADLVIK